MQCHSQRGRQEGKHLFVQTETVVQASSHRFPALLVRGPRRGEEALGRQKGEGTGARQKRREEIKGCRSEKMIKSFVFYSLTCTRNLCLPILITSKCIVYLISNRAFLFNFVPILKIMMIA